MGGVAGALAAAAAIVLVMATTSTRSDAGEPIRGASLDAAQQSASADSAQQALSAGVLEGDRPTDALDGG